MAREEATGNLCLGNRAGVHLSDSQPDDRTTANAHPTLALV